MNLEKEYNKNKDGLFKELFDFLLNKPEFYTDLFKAIRIVRQIEGVEKGLIPFIRLDADCEKNDQREIQVEITGEKKIIYLQAYNRRVDEKKERLELNELLFPLGWLIIEPDEKKSMLGY